MFTITVSNQVILIKLHKVAYKNHDIASTLWHHILQNWKTYRTIKSVQIEGGKHMKKSELEEIKSRLQHNFTTRQVMIRNKKIMDSYII